MYSGRILAVALAVTLALRAAGATSAAADTLATQPQYTTATWTTRDGLPSNYVLTLAQDRDGYLWIGTTAGVVRFDGERFMPWPKSGPFPAPNPVIYGIVPARDGSLWVVPGGPSRVIREHGGEITVFTPQEGLPEGGIRSLIERRDGTIWAGGNGGLARFRGGRWERLPDTLALFDGVRVADQIPSLVEDSQGTLWVVTPRGVFRERPDGTFTAFETPFRGPIGLSERDGRTIVADSRFATIGADGRVTRTEAIAGASAPHHVLSGPFAVLRDSRSHLWIGTNGEGLFTIDERHPGARLRLTERNGLAGDLVKAILEDRDGNIWVGTQAGLTRITEARIRSLTTRDDSMTENLTSLVADRSGSVWVRTGDNRLVRFTNGTRARVSFPSATEGSVNITAMHADADGGLWVATSDGRLTRHARGSAQQLPWPSGHPNVISAMTSDRTGRLWVFDGQRFLVLNSSSPVPAIDVPGDFRDVPLRFVHLDARMRLWVGIDGGKVAVHDGKAFHVYTDADGLPLGQLSGLDEDANGRIWIGSDNGLSTFEGGRFITLTTANGLPQARIFWVTSDDDSVWLGVGAGVLRIERGELERAVADSGHRVRYRVHDASDGLRGTPVIRGGPNVARGVDGSIWFVTSDGIAVIDPARLNRTQRLPAPQIVSIVLNGRREDATPGLRVPPNPSHLQVEYSALDLTSPSKVRFRHRLEGIDPTWIEDGTNRQISYSRLAPGAYRFLLSTSSGDGTWSREPAVWAFSVLPMWYQTRSFYTAGILAAAVLMWMAWQVRVRQIRKQFVVVLAERARVGREIHDTLLQSLVGMALQLDNLSDQIDEPSHPMKEELGRMRRQVEHYVEEAQQSIWELRTPRIETTDLATTMRDRAGQVTAGAGVRLEFVTTGTPRRASARVEQQILRIAQEAVVNAVRHAEPTVVRLELAYEGDSIHLRVSDDGHGFDPEAPNPRGESHWGMSIMRERAEQIGGRFQVSSAPNQGTHIEIIAPASAPAEAL